VAFCALIIFLESFSAVPLFIKRALEQTQCAAVRPSFFIDCQSLRELRITVHDNCSMPRKFHSRVEWSNGAKSEGGQNLVDQYNFVYRKARFSPDKSKQFFKCVKCDCLKCNGSVWIEVGTLIVNNTAMQEQIHNLPILEMATTVGTMCF
jgi:hypothetical protein